jgi:hypothetical protein
MENNPEQSSQQDTQDDANDQVTMTMTYPAKSPWYLEPNPREVEEEFKNFLYTSDLEFIAERKKVFDAVTSEITCEIGKVKHLFFID